MGPFGAVMDVDYIHPAPSSSPVDRMDTNWILESIGPDGSRIRQVIAALPFRIGRDPTNELAVEALGLSRRHAEIRLDGSGRLRIDDLGSTNGTFVNRERIQGGCLLGVNDVLHFGNAEYRLTVAADSDTGHDDPNRTVILPKGQGLSERFIRQEAAFLELLAGQGLSAAAQPIVDSGTHQLFAYELLGRSSHPMLPPSPVHLFHLAAVLGREAELSDAFRLHGVRTLMPRLRGVRLFVNAHPKETFTDAFHDSLCQLRSVPNAPELVVEIHESAIVEVGRMRELAARLHGIGIAIAYDDFGAGQARINELADVPAQFVKFDMGLVRDIHRASERKQMVVRDLVRMVKGIGSVPLAEGVEFADDAEVCRDMGFALLQGYHIGRPAPLDSI
jgi:EAL domain-containing protein (putative c-di-GMP-specific phosphodiesterase class I)